MGRVEFSKQGVFEYNANAKFRFALIMALVCGFIISVVVAYILFLKDADMLLFEIIERVVAHVKLQISSGSIQGVLYVSVLGGLFFITLPLEIIFISFLRNGVNPFMLIPLYVGGFIVSFTLNYIIGSRLNDVSMKIITPQKFYKFKGLLNKYGPASVFVFNVIPFFPAQPLSAILGVFKYNKAKFYTYFIAGEVVKYVAIAFIYVKIFM